MYSAPESYRDNNITRPQLCECDIWSLGGVASELLVWSIRGDRRRQEYQQRRCEATGATVLAGGYHEGSFHNSEFRLQTVDDEHRTIDKTDIVSQAVSRIILGHMLIADVAHRSSAIKTYENWTTASTFVRHRVRRPISRGDTRDSHYSWRSSLAKRPSVNSNHSLPRVNGDPWLDNDQHAGFSTEPGAMGAPGPWRMRGQSGTLSDHPEHGRRVDFAQEMGNGEGPSTFHGPDAGPAYWNRRRTRDSMRQASSIHDIPETNKQFQGSHNPIATLPLRSATGLTANSMLPSPPPARHRRTVDEFHSVDEVGESSASKGTIGLGVCMSPGAMTHIPSPPSTPRKDSGRSSENPGRSSTDGLQRAPTIRRTQTMVTIPEDAKITIVDVYEKIRSLERGKHKFPPPWKTRPDLLAESPRLADALTRLKGLNGREQVSETRQILICHIAN